MQVKCWLYVVIVDYFMLVMCIVGIYDDFVDFEEFVCEYCEVGMDEVCFECGD